MTIGTHVIESDGSIHELLSAGDADWHDETVTTLTEIRNNIIDEFVEKAWEVLGSEDRDIYARESIIEIAEMLKKKGEVNITGDKLV